MAKPFRFLLPFLLIASAASAQFPLKSLTIEDATLKQRSSLAPRRMAGLQWVKSSNTVSFTDTLQGQEWLMLKEFGDKPTQRMIALAELNSGLKSAGADTVKKWPPIKWDSPQVFQFEHAGAPWFFDMKSKSVSRAKDARLPESAEHVEVFSMELKAFVKEYNIWIASSDDSARQVTRDGNRELLYGTSVHRDEFGISKGLFWSPDSRRLAFYRMDQTMVTDYPMVDFSGRPATHEPIKYPFSGDSSHQVTLGVYDLKTGNTIYLKTGAPADQYLTNVTWSPDGMFIYIAVLNRGQDHMMLNRYSAVTGDLDKTLFEEKDPMYTEPLHPLHFVEGDPAKFIWQSRRDGWNHLYLYDTTGKLIRQLTQGDWEVSDFNGFGTKGRTAFFHSTSNTGIDRVFKSVELATGAMRVLTSGSGVHQCALNDQRTAFIDTWSNPEVPRVIRLVSVQQAGKVQTLLQAPNPLSEYAIGQTRLFTTTAADGKTPLWCRMILPAGFDSTRKYPAIVYLYGGPHAQMITNSWLAGADLMFHYLAQQGFIVFTIDNRGSSNRGKSFEQATFRKLGEEEMRDQIAGLNVLKSFRYIDASRIGVYGWSFGGFMTTSLMTRYPGVFKAAVAGGPVLDWSYYEVMYTERYMDTPQENPEGYRMSKLTEKVDQLNGKLLLIHGTSDDVVVWQHSLMFLKQAVSKGVQLDYFVYPGHLHNVSGKDRVHLNTKIADYFNTFLK